MEIKKGKTVELDIVAMAFGGRGIGRIDGLAVFVDHVVPGDRARVGIIKKRSSYAEARLVELLSPSEYRIDPPCPYAGFCGGCRWQHIRYDQQLGYKRQHVTDSLERIAGLFQVTVHPVFPSVRIYGYRNKMEFSCSDRRWLLPEEMDRPVGRTDFALGLHIPGTFNRIIDIQRCLLQPEAGNAILGTVRSLILNSGLPPYGLKSHAGFWRFVMLRHSEAHNRWMVNLVTASEDLEKMHPVADHLVRQHPEILSVVNNITAKKAGIAVGEREITLAGPSKISDRLGPYDFRISANSFFQVNPAGAWTLFNTAKRYAQLTGSETVLDLYSGTGAIAIALSENARSVIGMEIVSSAVEDAQENCRINGIANCRFLRGDILDLIPRMEERPDVVVIDPPRAGMHPKSVAKILELKPERMVYVSCNPATLARDLSLMKESYGVLEVQPVDMFPHTPHIEAVAKLERK
ncbi:MAG: 23S rRNA (uracil(1939)-C(5))-methyltransferase RlmD [Desulfobacterales bacterium CG07_land_8_20_14_0_80_52_14]|nr:MAG: 23S rRNA (uracil(1939)-C(5))-methyltransferase RlmD [Desulfobacterales bacterium CG07_land_8_20_14_0_80_52_14]